METSVTKAEKEHISDIQSSAVSSEAMGMRRDHESIDDFEHLEPELSPVTETSVKHVFDDLKQKTTGNSGKEAVSSTTSTFAGTVEENKNSSEFSLLGDSKLVSVKAGNTPEQLEEIASSEFTNKLIDFDTHEKNDKTKFEADSDTAVEKSLFTATEQKTSDLLFDAPTQKSSGLDLFNRLEISPKGSDASVLSQAFMDMERGGVKDEKHSENTGDISQPDLQHLGYKVDDILKPKTDIKEKSIEPDLNPALAHIKDDIHDDDSFKDTDSIPELTKSDEKFKDLPEDVQPSKHDVFPDYNKHGDFHAPAANVFLKGSEEFSSGDDKFTDLPEDIYDTIKEESKPKPNDRPTKQDLELGTPAPLIPRSTLEEKSPEKPKSGEQTAVTKRKESPKYDDEPVIAPLSLASIGLDAWFKPDRLHPKVVELVYWRDPKKSGIVFGSVLGILLSLTYFSLISVIAYLSLTILTGTVSFRVYKTVLQAVQKTTSDGHPFKDILELDLTLPQEKVREMTDLAVAHLNAAACELRRLFLVEDLVDSIKFGVLLWCLTYVGSWFNGMTLIIIAFVALFTLPKVYETNKVQIDQNIDLVRSKIAEISSKIKATIRVGGKKPEEKKE